MDNSFDRIFYPEGELIAGVDESGVTDIAGPLIGACVILPKIESLHKHDLRLFELRDCKQIPEKFRKQYAEIIWENAVAIGIGEVLPSEVDALYKFSGSALAMCRAILSCKTINGNKPVRPDFVIVDGNQPLPISIRQVPIADGDDKSLAVAAASVVAKVYRDNIMLQLHQRYPYYKWNKNKGYACEEHFRGIDRYGIQPGVHRVKRWPFIPGKPCASEEGAMEEKMWKIRRQEWQTATLKSLIDEAGGQHLWTTKPELYRGYESLNLPSPKVPKPRAPMLDSEKK